MIKRILLIIFVFVFLVSGFKISKALIENYQNKKEYESASEYFVRETYRPDPGNKHDKTNADLSVTIDFSGLKELNKDVYGWIVVPGTKINYPIMYSNDNEKYLRRSLNGKYNRLGSIFIDTRNSNDFSDWNTVVYGHRTANGTMFGSLLSYKDKEFLEKNKNVFIFTEEGTKVYEIFKAYATDVFDEVYDFDKEDEYYDEDRRVDKIITLSTCTISNKDLERFVVLGELVKDFPLSP